MKEHDIFPNRKEKKIKKEDQIIIKINSYYNEVHARHRGIGFSKAEITLLKLR